MGKTVPKAGFLEIAQAGVPKPERCWTCRLSADQLAQVHEARDAGSTYEGIAHALVKFYGHKPEFAKRVKYHFDNGHHRHNAE